MTPPTRPLEPGLHLVATPIGAARDITLRTLDVLSAADLLAAEDTRSLRRLLEIHGVDLKGRHIVAYHDHNGARMRPRLLQALRDGQSVAYAAEAGTPMVADPGYRLVEAAIAEGHPVRAAPGPSAVLAALTVSGLPSDRFLFAGFPPQQTAARRRFLAEIKDVPATLILFESPRRVGDLLTDLVLEMGPDRRAVICRELTKRFENVSRGTLGTLQEAVDTRMLKGEIVVLIDRAPVAQTDADTLKGALKGALDRATLKDAVSQVATRFGMPRRKVYQAALELRDDGEGGDP